MEKKILPPEPEYSTEYLNSIRNRFPEYAKHTEEDLVDILNKNATRIAWEYEIQAADAIKELEESVVFENDLDILGMCPESLYNKLTSWLSYVISKENWVWDIVLSVSENNDVEWWTSAVWSPISKENFSFIINDQDKDYLNPTRNKKILFVVSVINRYKEDSLWRPVFSLQPRLIEIAPSNVFLSKDMVFKKDLKTEEEVMKAFDRQ